MENSIESITKELNRTSFVVSVLKSVLRLNIGDSKTVKADSILQNRLKVRFTNLRQKKGIEFTIENLEGNVMKITRKNK